MRNEGLINLMFKGDFISKVKEVLPNYQLNEFIKIQDNKFINSENRNYKVVSKGLIETLNKNGWLINEPEKQYYSFKDGGIKLFGMNSNVNYSLIELLNVAGSVALARLCSNKSTYKNIYYNLINQMLYQFVDMLHSSEIAIFKEIDTINSVDTIIIKTNYTSSLLYINNDNIRVYRAIINYAIENGYNEQELLIKFNKKLSHLFKTLVNGMIGLITLLTSVDYVVKRNELIPVFNDNYHNIDNLNPDYISHQNLVSLDYLKLLPIRNETPMNINIYNDLCFHNIILDSVKSKDKDILKDGINLYTKKNTLLKNSKTERLYPFEYYLKFNITNKSYEKFNLLEFISLRKYDLTTESNEVKIDMDRYISNLYLKDNNLFKIYLFVMKTLLTKVNYNITNSYDINKEEFLNILEDISKSSLYLKEEFNKIKRNKSLVSFKKNINNIEPLDKNRVLKLIERCNNYSNTIPHYINGLKIDGDNSFINRIVNNRNYHLPIKDILTMSISETLLNLDLALNKINNKFKYVINFINKSNKITSIFNNDNYYVDIDIIDILYTNLYNKEFRTEIRLRDSEFTNLETYLEYNLIRMYGIYDYRAMFKKISVHIKKFVKFFEEVNSLKNEKLGSIINNIVNNTINNLYPTNILHELFRYSDDITNDFYKSLFTNSNLIHYISILENKEIISKHVDYYEKFYSKYNKSSSELWDASIFKGIVSEKFINILIDDFKIFNNIEEMNFLSLYISTKYFEIHKRRNKVYGNQQLGLLNKSIEIGLSNIREVSLSNDKDTSSIWNYFKNSIDNNPYILTEYELFNIIFQLYRVSYGEPIAAQIITNENRYVSMNFLDLIRINSSKVREFVMENKVVLDKFFIKMSRNNLFNSGLSMFNIVLSIIIYNKFNNKTIIKILENLSSNNEVQFNIALKQTITNTINVISNTSIFTHYERGKYLSDFYDFSLNNHFIKTLLISSVEGKISNLIRYFNLSNYQNIHNFSYMFTLQFKGESEVLDNVIKMIGTIINNGASIKYILNILKIYDSNPETLNIEINNISELKDKLKKIELDIMMKRVSRLIPIKSLDETLPKRIDIPKNYDHKDGFSIHFHDHNDEQVLTLGEITNCCQTIGGGAETSVLEGVMNPYSGFISYKKDGKIIAQSWIWLSVDKKTLVIDSIETRYLIYLKPLTEMLIDWSKEIPYNVAIGVSHTKIDKTTIDKSDFKFISYSERSLYSRIDTNDSSYNFKEREIENVIRNTKDIENRELIKDIVTSQLDSLKSCEEDINSIRSFYKLNTYPSEEFDINSSYIKALLYTHRHGYSSLFKIIPITIRNSGYMIPNYPANQPVDGYRNDVLYTDAKGSVYFLKK